MNDMNDTFSRWESPILKWMFGWLLRKKSVEAMEREELEKARYNLSAHEMAAEEHHAQVEMLRKRVARLSGERKASTTATQKTATKLRAAA